MCKLHSSILSIRAEDNLTNDQISQRMSAIQGEQVSVDTVAKYFAANAAGITIDKVEAFLGAFGFKVVQKDFVCLPQKKYDAMLTFSEDGLESMKSGHGVK